MQLSLPVPSSSNSANASIARVGGGALVPAKSKSAQSQLDLTVEQTRRFLEMHHERWFQEACLKPPAHKDKQIYQWMFDKLHHQFSGAGFPASLVDDPGYAGGLKLQRKFNYLKAKYNQYVDTHGSGGVKKGLHAKTLTSFDSHYKLFWKELHAVMSGSGDPAQGHTAESGSGGGKAATGKKRKAAGAGGGGSSRAGKVDGGEEAGQGEEEAGGADGGDGNNGGSDEQEGAGDDDGEEGEEEGEEEDDEGEEASEQDEQREARFGGGSSTHAKRAKQPAAGGKQKAAAAGGKGGTCEEEAQRIPKTPKELLTSLWADQQARKASEAEEKRAAKEQQQQMMTMLGQMTQLAATAAAQLAAMQQPRAAPTADGANAPSASMPASDRDDAQQ